jgi:prophage tail gpP-like protein
MPDFPDTIEVEDASIDQDTGLSDEVSLVIDDTPYKFWTTVNINLSLDNLADTFSLSGPFEFDNFNFQDIFRPYKYKDVAIYVAGIKQFQGTMLTPKPSNKGSSSVVTVEGYSGPGIIGDVNVAKVDWPVQMNGLNLQEIAEKLLDPFGIVPIFTVSPGAKFTKDDKVRIEVDEKIGSFLIKLAKQRGIIISSNADNELEFHGITSGKAEVSIIGGKPPWIGSDPVFNGQNMFSEITAIGTNNKKGPGKSATVQNPLLSEVPRIRPLSFRASDISQGGLKDAATAKLGRMLAESVAVNLSCVGWHRPDGTLWRDNQKIVYQSDRDMLYNEAEYITRNVNFKKVANAATTDIELVFPESYNGEVKTSFPWES